MSPHDQGRSSFHQVAKEVGRQGCSKQRNHDFSGAEFLPGKKRSLSSSCSALLSSQGMRVLPSDRPTVLYWVLVKIPPASAEDVRDGGSTPGSGSSSGGGNGNPSHFLLKGIFSTQGLNPAFSSISSIDRWILYHCATWEDTRTKEAFNNVNHSSFFPVSAIYTILCPLLPSRDR